jgi:hypothetical protein
MTEQEWLNCTDPHKMLQFLGPTASERRLRLFAMACCRQVWRLLTEKRSQKAVEIVEQILEGALDPGALPRAHDLAHSAAYHALKGSAPQYVYAGQAASMACYDGDALGGAYNAARTAVKALEHFAKEQARKQGHAQARIPGSLSPGATARRSQCGWLRDLFGPLPFRPVIVDPAVLACNGGAARRLAEAIATARRFEDLPVLADLLEESGLTDAALLAHLRGPGPHCLGCHVLDAVRGKA